MCDFILENCLVPMVTKPVSVEYSAEKDGYLEINISYSIKNVSKSLLPSYKQVFAHVKTFFDCLANINVNVSPHQHVFGIIGNHIKDKFLKVLVHECLMYAVPETMDEYKDSTLLEDVEQFENVLAGIYFINPEKDKALSEFATDYDSLFQQRFSTKVLESASLIMHKDLQDMVLISEGNTEEELKKNHFLFPQCMVSKSTLVSYTKLCTFI